MEGTGADIRRDTNDPHARDVRPLVGHDEPRRRSEPRAAGLDDDKSPPKREEHDEEKELQVFLQEIRVLLPGTQVLGGFLISVPFQQRFQQLSEAQHAVFLVTFLSTMLALVCFLTPALYHRMTTPLHHKRRFIVLGTRFLIAGFVPLTVSTALSIQLVTSLVVGGGWASITAGAFGAMCVAFWWVVPKLRVHHRMRVPE